MNQVFVEVEYNNREFEGIDEFENDISKDYHFQIRPKWMAAAAGGGELWATVFINSSIIDFVAGALVGGFLYDVVKVGAKEYILNPLFKAFERLNKKNEIYGGLKVLKLRFQFDDCEIVVGGLNENFLSTVSKIFQELSTKIPKFERDQDSKVIKIELPIFHNPSIDKKGYSPYLLDTFLDKFNLKYFFSLWKLTFQTGHPILIYDFNKDEYLDAYPN